MHWVEKQAPVLTVPVLAMRADISGGTADHLPFHYEAEPDNF